MAERSALPKFIDFRVGSNGSPYALAEDGSVWVWSYNWHASMNYPKELAVAPGWRKMDAIYEKGFESK